MKYIRGRATYKVLSPGAYRGARARCIAGYRSLLRENGFTLLDAHIERGENTYYLARKLV